MKLEDQLLNELDAFTAFARSRVGDPHLAADVVQESLLKALKSVEAEVQEKIFKNMSKRAAALLREDMDFMGPVRLKDVEDCQQKIVNIIRKLEDAGEIVVARAGEEELVV